MIISVPEFGENPAIVPKIVSKSETTGQVTPQVTGQVTPQVTGQVAPEVTPEVTPEVMALLKSLTSPMSRQEIMEKLGLRDEKHFRQHYQQKAVADGLIELTLPDKPNSRLQKYRRTASGKALLENNKP